MFSKELKKLSRRELVEVIYQLKKNDEERLAQIAALEEALQEKRIHISVAGSIAEAAKDITQLFATAQSTADLYLREIAFMKEEAEKESAATVEAAKAQAAQILAEAQQHCADINARYEALYEKYQVLSAQLQQLEETRKDG